MDSIFVLINCSQLIQLLINRQIIQLADYLIPHILYTLIQRLFNIVKPVFTSFRRTGKNLHLPLISAGTSLKANQNKVIANLFKYYKNYPFSPNVNWASGEKTINFFFAYFSIFIQKI
jgi:hypothetical protein